VDRHHQRFTAPPAFIGYSGGLSTLKKWVQQDQDDDLMSRSHEGVEKENARPCKEPRLLVEEREVFKKLTIFFAGQSR
jgi:transposase